MKPDNEDRQFKKLLSKNRKEMPFPGFEDDVMMRIGMIETSRKVSRKDTLYSWICFGAGILFGLMLTFLIPQLEGSFLGMDSGQFLLLFQIGFCLFVLLHLEKLIMLRKPGEVSLE